MITLAAYSPRDTALTQSMGEVLRDHGAYPPATDLVGIRMRELDAQINQLLKQRGWVRTNGTWRKT